MKRIRVFADAADFIGYIAQNIAIPENQTAEQYALWVVCVLDADAILESCTTSDIANMLMNGVAAKNQNPLVSIEDFVSTYSEDVRFAVEGGEPDPVVDGWISEEDAELHCVTDVLEHIHRHFPKVHK